MNTDYFHNKNRYADKPKDAYRKPKQAYKAKPRRVYTPPIPAKPCKVYLLVNGSRHALVKEGKVLMMNNHEPTEQFDSMGDAKKARWHTIQFYNAHGIYKQSGANYWDTDFELVEI